MSSVTDVAGGDRLIIKRETARRIGVCARQIDKLVAAGRFPSPVRIGRSVRWRESDLTDFIRLGCDMEAYRAERARAAGTTS